MDGVPHAVVPKISQQTLADMVGTTRSRVSFFMNRFRRLGFIEYSGGQNSTSLQVHSSLLGVVLQDAEAKVPSTSPKRSGRGRRTTSDEDA
jgi:hypothetical protein